MKLGERLRLFSQELKKAIYIPTLEELQANFPHAAGCINPQLSMHNFSLTEYHMSNNGDPRVFLGIKLIGSVSCGGCNRTKTFRAK